jgi:hypothetical protein
VARDFNGTTQYFSSSDNDFDFTSTNMMFEVWFRLDSNTGLQTIFGKYDDTSFEYMLYMDGNALKFAYYTDVGSPSILTHYGALAVDTWYFALVGRDTDANIWIRAGLPSSNSVLDLVYSTGTASPTANGTADFTVGRVMDTSDPSYLNGKIGPLRFWKTYPDEVKTDYFTSTAFWLFYRTYTKAPGVGLTYDSTGRTYSELSAAGTATFVGTDTTTKGSWVGVYGADGYLIVNTSQGNSVIPAYADICYVRDIGNHTVGINAAGEFIWNSAAAGTTDYMLEHPTNPAGIQSAATFYNGSATGIALMFDAGATTRRLSLYFLDYDNVRTGQDVEVVDMVTGASLDGPRDLGTFNTSSPKWLSWDVTGPISIRVYQSGSNAVISAVMFDTPATSSSFPIFRHHYLNQGIM